jgi:hypothetical protein
VTIQLGVNTSQFDQLAYHCREELANEIMLVSFGAWSAGSLSLFMPASLPDDVAQFQALMCRSPGRRAGATIGRIDRCDFSPVS